jgi:ABC-type transport system substrate-binding protein
MAVSETAANRLELRATAPGVNGQPIARNEQVYEIFISSQISSADTRWTGANSGAYRNPTYDALYDRYLVTLDTPARRQLAADMEKMLADDAASIHTRYDLGTNIIAFRKGIRGPDIMGPLQMATTWNAYSWDMD